MTCLRPATPGFIVSLIATLLLALVVFCVPYAKSIYFLKASYEGVSGNITFGTLGYCLEQSGNTTCSSPSIGYKLDLDSLLGNTLPVKIPDKVGKWVTYALFIHVIALVGAAASALFGLLAHVREMSMTCCSICFSGFGAMITVVAFLFDIIVFYLAKAAIQKVNGSAQIGSAVWLTLVAWALLFFSGCFFAFGRCCMRGRPSRGGGKWLGNRDSENPGPDKEYAEQTRLAAVKAEADRKARQKQGEIGLPAFYETQPLTGVVEGDQVHLDGGRSDPSPPPSANFHGGYAPGRAGSRAMDDYHRSDSSPASTVYPPQPQIRRQESQHSSYSVPTSPPINSTRPSGYGQYNNAPLTTSPPPNNQLLVPFEHHQRYNSDTSPGPYGREYGHIARGTSYHTASSHDQTPSSYGINNPYTYQPQQQTPYQANPYMPTFPSPTMPQATITDYFPPISTSTSPIQQPQPLHRDRSYSRGDGYGYGGYGSNELPPLPEHQPSLPPGAGAPSYLAFGQQSQHQLSPIDTDVDAGLISGHHIQTSPRTDESPPSYDSSAVWRQP